VVASNAAMADALSTALILANGDHLAKRLVKQHLAHSVLLEDFSRNFVRHS
jgi:thiamine biosynthesis lipoprotein ApbE